MRDFFLREKFVCKTLDFFRLFDYIAIVIIKTYFLIVWLLMMRETDLHGLSEKKRSVVKEQ
jgi:hypothetical protein